MISVMNTRTRAMPRSLTHPAGVVFLDPADRVSREELDRRDRRWRAMRERAYARAWSDEATLVGSVRRYAAASAVIREWEERTMTRRNGAATAAVAAIAAPPSTPAMMRRSTMNTFEEGSTVYSQRAPSDGRGANARGTRRLSHLLHVNHRGATSAGNGSIRHRPRKFKETFRRWVRSVRV